MINSKKRKILLTGASGFLGQRAQRELGPEFDIVATYHAPVGPTVTGSAVVWEASKGSPEALIALTRPDAVLHLLAMARTDICSREPELAHRVNVEAARHLGEAACLRNIPFIFTSTDLVFDGARGNYTEADAPNPVNTYARTKQDAEQALRNVFHGKPELLTIFRIGLSYGWGDPGHSGPAGWLLYSLRNGKPVDLFRDEFRTPLYQGDAVRAFRDAIAQQISGLYHLGGADRVNRCTLGRRMAETFGLDASLIRSQSIVDYTGPEKRSPDCSMISTKFTDTFGWHPRGIESGLAAMKADEAG